MSQVPSSVGAGFAGGRSPPYHRAQYRNRRPGREPSVRRAQPVAPDKGKSRRQEPAIPGSRRLVGCSKDQETGLSRRPSGRGSMSHWKLPGLRTGQVYHVYQVVARRHNSGHYARPGGPGGGFSLRG